MQIHEPFDCAIHCRMWIAQVCSRVRIEQAFDSFVAAFQYNVVRLIGALRLANVIHFIGRVGALRVLRQFVGAHPVAGRSYDYYFPRVVPLVHNRAAGDADGQNVESNSQANPQMNLEKRLANPQTLGTLKPSLPGCDFRLLQVDAGSRGKGNDELGLGRNLRFGPLAHVA